MLCTALLCAHLAIGIESPPHFILDLDAPADSRWEGAVSLVLAHHPFDSGFGPAFASHNASLFDKLSDAQYEALGSAVERHYPEHAAELHSIASQFLAAGYYVSFQYLSAWVYFHELAHTELQDPDSKLWQECSAVVAMDATGAVLHGGNMDQSPTAVRNVTLQISLSVQNQTVARGVDWYWFTTGATRMVRKGVASLQENWRHSVPPLSSVDVFEAIASGVMPQVWVFRHALTDDLTSTPRAAEPSFQSVAQAMADIPLAAPYYVIMAGPKMGMGLVIARNTTGVAGPLLHLARHSADPINRNGSWFVAQTNYDSWLPDDSSDPRRTAAQNTLQQMGRANAASQLGLYAALGQYPVHNPHTAYTAIMDPAAGTLQSFVRQAMCPQDSGQSMQDARYCQA